MIDHFILQLVSESGCFKEMVAVEMQDEILVLIKMLARSVCYVGHKNGGMMDGFRESIGSLCLDPLIVPADQC